jgi:hypothetical protein
MCIHIAFDLVRPSRFALAKSGMRSAMTRGKAEYV